MPIISLLKAMSAKHRSKFAALSPGNGDSRRIDEKVLRRLFETKQSLMTLSCLSEKKNLQQDNCFMHKYLCKIY
jgi:hypothetical protein